LLEKERQVKPNAPVVYQVPGELTYLALNDHDQACGFTKDQTIVCAENIFNPKWNPAPTSEKFFTFVLTNENRICGITLQHKLECQLKDTKIPAYPGEIVSLAIQNDGLCVVTKWGNVSCYFINESPEWKLYDTPPRAQKVSFSNSKLCTLGEGDQLSCSLKFHPLRITHLKWDQMHMHLKNLSAQYGIMCGANAGGAVFCIVDAFPWKLYRMNTSLSQIQLNSIGTLCGVAKNRSIWCGSDLVGFLTKWDSTITLPPKKPWTL
jgi:hypothetical protein